MLFRLNDVCQYIDVLVSSYLQKNPSTIRQPEEDRGRENYTMTGWVNLPKSMVAGKYVAPLCSEAADSTYVRDSDMEVWASKSGRKKSLYA